MDRQDVMDYVLNTPTNTNPRILKEMLSSIQGEGGSSSSGKVRIVDSLPENGEDGDLVLITKQYLDEPQDVILMTENAINEVFDIEDYYNYYKTNILETEDNLTEEQKTEARNNGRAIEYFIYDNKDSDGINIEKQFWAVFPSLTNSVTFVNPGTHERVEVDEEDFHEKTIDGTTIKIYDSDATWSYMENTNENKGLYCHYIPVISSNTTYFYDDDKRDYYVPYKDGYINSDGLLISSSAETVFWVPVLTNTIEGNPETDSLPSDKEGYVKMCMGYMYLPSGTYEVYGDHINLSNQEVENAGWYTFLIEAPSDMDWDHADMEEIFMGLAPTVQSDFYTIEVDLLDKCEFRLDYLINENNKVVLNLPERPYLNFYEWNASTGLFIRKNKKWETIPIGELEKSFFDNLLNEEIIENKQGLFLLAYTPYLNDNNELVLNGYEFGNDSDGVEYSHTNRYVDLNHLKDTDTDRYINDIQRYPDGDDSYSYCYHAYRNYKDGDTGYDNYDYLTFYIPKQDLSNYVTNSTLNDYVQTSTLNNTLEGYVQTDTLNNTLDSYATKQYVTNQNFAHNSDLSDYVQTNTLNNTLGDYVQTNTLNSTLNDYVTNIDLTNTLYSKIKYYYNVAKNQQYYSNLINNDPNAPTDIQSILPYAYNLDPSASYSTSINGIGNYIIIADSPTDKISWTSVYFMPTVYYYTNKFLAQDDFNQFINTTLSTTYVSKQEYNNVKHILGYSNYSAAQFEQLLNDNNITLADLEYKFSQIKATAYNLNSNYQISNSNAGSKYIVVYNERYTSNPLTNYDNWNFIDFIKINYSDEISALETRIAALEGNNNS